MKTLKQHIDEALKIGKNLSEWSSYSCQPKTKDEFVTIIRDRISKEGSNCDLNDIDTSLITDMSWLFYNSKFNGDISRWDVSNVKNMSDMFGWSCFNHDISKWNVRNVKNMSDMSFFLICTSRGSKLSMPLSPPNITRPSGERAAVTR